MKKLILLLSLVFLLTATHGFATEKPNLHSLLIRVSVNHGEIIVRNQLTNAVITKYKADSPEYQELSKIIKKGEKEIITKFPFIKSEAMYAEMVHPE